MMGSNGGGPSRRPPVAPQPPSSGNSLPRRAELFPLTPTSTAPLSSTPHHMSQHPPVSPYPSGTTGFSAASSSHSRGSRASHSSGRSSPAAMGLAPAVAAATAAAAVPTWAMSGYDMLVLFLGSHVDKNRESLLRSRSSSSKKISDVPLSQLSDLASDVSEEIRRRLNLDSADGSAGAASHTSNRRVKARASLSTLSSDMFLALATDLFFELEARFSYLLQASKRRLSKSAALTPDGISHRSSRTASNANSNAASSTPEPPLLKPLPGREPAGSTSHENGQSLFANFSSLDALISDLDDVIKNGDQSQAQLELKTRNDQNEILIASMKQEIESLKKQQSVLTGKLKDEEEQKLGAIKKYTSLETKLEALRQQNNHLLSEAADHKLQYKKLFDENESLKAKLQKRDETIQQLREKLTAEQQNASTPQNSAFGLRSASSLSASQHSPSNSSQGYLSGNSAQLLQKGEGEGEGEREREGERKGGGRREKESPLTGTQPSALSSLSQTRHGIENISLQPENPTLQDYSSKIYEEIKSMQAYSAALRNFLSSFAKRSHTEVLESMKSIVQCCRELTELLDSRSKNSNLTPDDIEALKSKKSQLSQCLTKLMGTVKSGAMLGASAELSQYESVMETAKTHSSTLTQTMEVLACLYLKCSRTKKDSILSVPSQSFPVVSPGRSPSQSNLKQHSPVPPPVPKNENEKNQHVSAAAFGSAAESASADLWPERRKLLVFLESKTGQIVKTIQLILKAMNESQFGAEFDSAIESASSIVSEVISFCNGTLASEPPPLKLGEKSRPLLEHLGQSDSRLQELAKEVIKTPELRKIKQGLASASYEVAKYIRDLLFLFDPNRRA